MAWEPIDCELVTDFGWLGCRANIQFPVCPDAESGIWKFVLVSMRSRAWKSTTSHSWYRARARRRSRKQRLQTLGVGLARDAALGDDGGNVAVRRDVESGMPRLDVLRRDRHSRKKGLVSRA